MSINLPVTDFRVEGRAQGFIAALVGFWLPEFAALDVHHRPPAQWDDDSHCPPALVELLRHEHRRP